MNCCDLHSHSLYVSVSMIYGNEVCELVFFIRYLHVNGEMMVFYDVYLFIFFAYFLLHE